MKGVVAILLISLSSVFGNGPVNVRDFGAAGDGITDDTQAVRLALSASSQVHFPAGVYRLSDGIELPPSAAITGDGTPVLGTFPIRDDDKRFFAKPGAPGLPGTTLLFTGKGQADSSTGRSDEFTKVRYAVKTGTGLPFSVSDLAIVLDVRVIGENGKVTKAADDERAEYDVGLLVDDSPGGSVKNVSVFGYWKKAGLLVTSRGMGSNPDYNSFWNCRFSGEYGVALLGQQKEGPGLSGTQFYGCQLFSADHHSRTAGHTGSGALYIDGKTSAKRANINGHYFFGGCIRTYNNVAVRLNHATNITFSGVIFEVPAMNNGDTESDTTGKVIGTAETGDVSFFGCRMHDIGLSELGSVMKKGNLTVAGNSPGGIEVHSGGSLARIHSGNGADPVIQLSHGGSASNDGWTIRSDISENNLLAVRYDNAPVARLTRDGHLSLDTVSTSRLRMNRLSTRNIENGSISAGASRIRIRGKDSEILHTVNGGEPGGILLLERSEKSEPFIAATTANGNLQLTKPFTFDHQHDRITLLRTGAQWVEIARSDFPAH